MLQLKEKILRFNNSPFMFKALSKQLRIDQNLKTKNKTKKGRCRPPTAFSEKK